MKSKDKKEEKNKYSKPILIKHKKLNDVTGGMSPAPYLGCTRSY
ncbi:MAG: hypothetical protein WCA08_10670 [Desulfoferrobacter sp.]